MAQDCSGFIQPLDWECLLVNLTMGSMELFMFVAVIFIAGMGAYFRMLNVTILIMFGLFAVLMAQYMQGLYFLVVMAAGLFAAFAIGRTVKQ